MPSKKKSSDTTDNPGFEDALSQIEDIVESMENGELPLEDLVKQYETGSKLLKYCENLLSSARQRIELITLANREESEPTSPANPPQAPPVRDSHENNDISLF
jgi:exodeoxyribonuclease VII small subunit